MRIILTPNDVLRLMHEAKRLPPGDWAARAELDALNPERTGNVELVLLGSDDDEEED